MAAGHDQATEGQATERSPIRRRGILAVAAAAMAGIAAKQLAEPVGATAGGTNGTALIIGANSNPGSLPNTYAVTTTLRPASGSTVPATNTPSGVALYGVGVDGQEGLYGICYGSVGYGVAGRTDSGYGVYGLATSASATTSFGVYGQSFASAGYGVYGLADGAAATGVNGTTGSGTGVKGVATSSGTGVKGSSASGFPVVGVVTGSGSASNVSPAVYGTGTAGPGVQGQSTGGHGPVGTTAATDGHAGLIGYASAPNGIGLRGSAANGATLAGVFDGDVSISGALRVYGAPKSAAVKHPDGSHRLLYCMESPESWFEDFGEGTLVNGKADVALDRDFAALVDTGRLHVFPVAHDEHHLHVAQRTASGFTVAATPSAAAHAAGKKAGDLGGTFSYRVVARRKDIKGERLAKVELPKDAPFDVAKATAPPPPPPRNP